jgi:hypothetical protein
LIELVPWVPYAGCGVGCDSGDLTMFTNVARFGVRKAVKRCPDR